MKTETITLSFRAHPKIFHLPLNCEEQCYFLLCRRREHNWGTIVQRHLVRTLLSSPAFPNPFPSSPCCAHPPVVHDYKGSLGHPMRPLTCIYIFTPSPLPSPWLLSDFLPSRLHFSTCGPTHVFSCSRAPNPPAVTVSGSPNAWSTLQIDIARHTDAI